MNYTFDTSTETHVLSSTTGLEYDQYGTNLGYTWIYLNVWYGNDTDRSHGDTINNYIFASSSLVHVRNNQGATLNHLVVYDTVYEPGTPATVV